MVGARALRRGESDGPPSGRGSGVGGLGGVLGVAGQAVDERRPQGDTRSAASTPPGGGEGSRLPERTPDS